MGSSKKGSSGGQVDVKSFPFQLYLGLPASPSLKIFLPQKGENMLESGKEPCQILRAKMPQ